jgi:hypothetical protein
MLSLAHVNDRAIIFFSINPSGLQLSHVAACGHYYLCAVSHSCVIHISISLLIIHIVCWCRNGQIKEAMAMGRRLAQLGRNACIFYNYLFELEGELNFISIVSVCFLLLFCASFDSRWPCSKQSRCLFGHFPDPNFFCGFFREFP